MAYASPWTFSGNSRVDNFIENMKKTKKVFPMATVPVKDGVTLYQHQIRAFNIMLAIYGYLDKTDPPAKGSGAALFMDMGTGKSLSALSVTGRLFLDNKIKCVLIVAPSSVCSVWSSEYGKFAGFPVKVSVLLGTKEKRIKELTDLLKPTPKGQKKELRVAVINYESTWRLYDELAAFKPDMIICDESQRIKGHLTKQSKAMHKLGAIAKYRCILSGTPIQNDVRDVWSQYKFLAPNVFGCTYPTFVKKYVRMGGFDSRQYLGVNRVTQAELMLKIHSIAYRVTKSECLDLPDKIFTDRIVTLESSARRLYKKLSEQAIAELSSGGVVKAANVLTKLLRFQQIAGGFLSDDSGNMEIVSTAKLDALQDIIETYSIEEEKKIVVFARFRPEHDAIIHMVESLFMKTGLKYVAICGDTPTTKREDIINQFQTDPSTRVFIGQIDACAEGITLNKATTTVYYSVNWNYAKYQQSQDRTHRIGVDGSCHYINLIAAKTIDTMIIAALKNKEDISKGIVDGWRKLFLPE